LFILLSEGADGSDAADAALGKSDRLQAKRHLQAQSEQQVSHLLDF